MLRRTLLLVAACLLVGCHRPVEPADPLAQEITLTATDEYDLLLEACLDTLRSHRFQLDRVDRHAGVITTFPVTSQQFFEFWRNDVDTASDLVEASLLTIRRRAEVRVLDETPGLHKRLAVAVYREKFSTPDRQYNSSAAALRFFSRSTPSTAGRRIIPERDEVWIPAGRDVALEQRLIREISQRVPGAGWSLSEDAGELADAVPMGS